MARKRVFSILVILLLLLLSPPPVLADIYIQSDFEKFLLGFWGSLIIITLVNMIFEVIILFVLGLRKRKQILSILLANLISWPVFYYLSSETTNQLLTIVFYEILVVLFETIFIYIFNREFKLLKLLLKVFLANLLSATVGTYILFVGVLTLLFTLFSLLKILMKQLFFFSIRK